MNKEPLNSYKTSHDSEIFPFENITYFLLLKLEQNEEVK